MTSARRLVVEVRSGALRGVKAVVEPHASLRVGRTDRADLVVERDASMSGVHLELAWDGERCTLRDLASARGTKLSGAPIERATQVPHGGWIQAGETSFSVYVEAWSPLRGAPADPVVATRALSVLRPKVGALYAVLDAARDRRIRELCRESVDEARSLYDGVQGEALADVAPQLVRFAKDSELLTRLVSDGWGKSWGVFLESRAAFTAVRRHLRRFLIVEEEDTKKRLYFRYYDPRVLREFMPLATLRQSDEIFADVVLAFLAEGELGEVATFAAPTHGERMQDAADS
jgi:hypothetical protein